MAGDSRESQRRHAREGVLPVTSLCALHERDKREQTRRQRIKRAGFGTAVLVAHDAEHAWRCAGEQAIREEMERRVNAYLLRKVKH